MNDAERRCPRLRRAEPPRAVFEHRRARAAAVLAIAGVFAASGIACGTPRDDARSSAVPVAYVPLADAAGCEQGNPEEERHGTDCMCCHTGDFTVAGSVDLTGNRVARVVVEDSVGGRAEMEPDAYGNFFRHAPLVPPLRAWAYGLDGSVRAMPMPAPHAACNACHHEGATKLISAP